MSMVLPLRKVLPKSILISPWVAGLAAILPLAAATLTAAPAHATPGCQAIDSTGLLTPPPTGPIIPSPACSQTIIPGNTFEIDFSGVFNATDFALTNTYSLQIANINPLPPGSQLSFSDVELLITGKFQPAIGPEVVFNAPTAIRVWQAGGQTGQGISNYSTNGMGMDFGLGEAFTSANFTLGAPQLPPGTFGAAGVINTIPINLALAGVTEFNSVKIRGKLSGGTDFSANPDFSAGLGIFTINSASTGVPNIIYGNAFNAEPVPGPLPVIGAGAAFGWSRRLRKRVKKASAATAAVV